MIPDGWWGLLPVEIYRDPPQIQGVFQARLPESCRGFRCVRQLQGEHGFNARGVFFNLLTLEAEIGVVKHICRECLDKYLRHDPHYEIVIQTAKDWLV